MKKFIVFCLCLITLSMFSCKLWMSDDNFFTDIEKEVKVAKAEKINVYVGYAMTRQGKTTPDGNDIFKVEVPHEISAVTEPEYGFVRWAAFTTNYLSTTDQSKNKEIYFIDDEDYEARIKPNELTEDIVSFEDVLDKDGKKVEGAATVTIHKPRNDIYLVPIIAQRPTISLTIPAKGSSGVVKNMSIRINFTKPMDTDSFKNEISGEYDKIVITQGIQTFLPDGGIDFNDENITDRFELSDSMFSANKKMITLKFKEEYISEGYDSQSSVTITISREVRDIFGFEMTDDNEISFTVGSKKDSLAPRITWLSAGPDKNFEAFQGVYKDVGSIDNLGQKTRVKMEGASLAPTNDIEDTFYDNYVPNRIGKDSSLILRVFAEDLAGSGSGQSLDGIESDVTRIGIRAKHLYNSDGTADKDAKMTDIEYQVYVPQTNGTSLSGSYRDLVNNANAMLPEGSDTLDSSYGTLFEYDISKMPDGLIQVDVAAVDQVGNIGFFDGGNESTEYGNAWTTLFIVKDTTPPDADANKGYVQADLHVVPNGRGMFNAEYYKKLAVIESNAGAIKDKGNHRLVAPNSELKWIVNPGSDTTWINSITADSTKWKLVSEGYKPAESSLPEVDGPVDFTYALMDNLGNISEAVIFNSVTYDNTIPTLEALKIQGINGYISTSITGNILENQILYIPVSDETAGLESIEISTSCIKNEETYPEYDKPFASGSLVVKVDDVPVKYTVDGKKLTLENTIIGNTTVTIQGLQIADADNVIDDSTYRISVSVTDAALNTSVVNTCDIKNDSTAPVINYVRVKNINSGIVGDSAEEFWTTEVEPKTALYINLTETNTGAKVFDFAGSTIKLTSNSELIWKEESLPIEIDTVANKLTVTDEYKTVITQATGGEVIITNVELTEENRVVLAISDLVTNTSERKNNFTLTDNRTIDLFKYDSVTPSVKAVVLKDQAPGTGGAAETGYTDNEYVEATVSVEATASGVYKLTITGASFDSTTLVNGKQSTDATEGFEISSDARTITLRTSGNKVNRILKGTFDIKLGNVKLPANDGDKNVSFTVTSVANRTSDETADAQTSIRLDKTAPVWDGEGVYVAETNASRKASIYPHVSTSAAGNVKIGGTVYFYTKDVINVAADIIDTNRKDGNVDLFIDGTTTPVAEYKDVAPGKHTVYAVDKAGNKSAEKIFYVVGDTEGPAAFDGYVTFTMPEGGNIYRGNAPTEASGTATQNYVIKQNAKPYQIIVKLSGVTNKAVDVHGVARTALDRFTELEPQIDKSLVEYYAFSTDGSQDWQPIDNGTITIDLPLTGDCTPYTVYLKDGCGNITQYTVPVNWKVDGSIVPGGKDIKHDSLYPNTAEDKLITYYKGNTTPVFSLISFNDTCYYPNDETVEAGINKSTDKYTLKSRLLAWPNNETVPSRADFYSSSIEASRFSPWSYLTLKTPADKFTMTHNYPKYDVTTAFKLYFIVEDKLGNYTITQLKNETDGTELWMYDNTPPSITVEAGAKINTIDGTNYYSDVSTLSLNMTDTQSGIEFDGARNYTGSDVKNTLQAVEYSLANLDPRSDFTFKINGIKDYVQNIMPDTEGLKVNSTANWVKQTAPTLPDEDAAIIITYNGIANGTSNYTSKLTSESDGSRKIEVKSPRSVTGLKFGFKVTSCDTADLLGWIITTEPLTSFDDFYSKDRVGTGEGKDITVLTRNGDDKYEYIYTKTDTTQKWEEIDKKIQYFYAINRAGLICQKPIIVEFVENPIPVVSNLEYTDVKTLENVNYIKESTTIKFVTRKDIPNDDVSQNETVAITKLEFYKGNDRVLTKDFTAAPLTEYTLTAAEATVIPVLYDNELTVKLYTATEESIKYELTDSEQGLASSNVWRYDGIAPVINSIKVKNINSAIEGTKAEEYWTTETTPQTALYINLTEVNTGAKIFDFAGSTVKLREDTVLTWDGANLPIEVDTEANKLTITDDTKTVKTAATGGQVVISNFDLDQTATGNSIKLVISDYVINPSAQKSNFVLEDNTDITLFKYDGETPAVTSVTLTDRAIGEGGNAEVGFTNEEYINASVGISPTISGVSKITVIGAEFDATTTVNDKNAGDASAGFAISADKKTITLRTSGNTENRILRGNQTITIENVKLPSGDGDKNVSFTVTSLADRTSVAKEASIRLDMTNPAWVGDGVFVGENADTTKIYPHSSTSASGNIKISDTIYFYTKDTINLAANVSDTNRKANNKDLCMDVTTINDSTNLVIKFDGVTPNSHTIYAVDKAGNRSVGKTFNVVGDTADPADFDGYITFTMPTGGNIYRGNADTESTKNYILKKNADYYNIHVKLGTGVAATEIDVNGANRTAKSRYEQLSPLAGSSPIEYYKITGDTVTDSETINTDWLPITSTGDLLISLPKNRDCSPVTIWLKDGCSNISSTIVPVNWYVDGNVTITTVGDSNISYSQIYPNTGDQKMITYYKGDTTPFVKLNGYSDSCYYPTEDTLVTEDTAAISTDHYTLKSRILAWSNNDTAPSRADFDSTTIDSTRFSNWVYLRAKNATESMAQDMQHHYPKYNVLAGSEYKLYYIIEDKLGNYKIEKLRNATSNTELWMWDNTPPSITVETAGKVNTVSVTEGTDEVSYNYYSDVSTLSLTINDTQSGIEWDGSAHYADAQVENDLTGIIYSLNGINPDNERKLKINGIKDYVENIMPDTDGLAYNTKNLWKKQTTPSLAAANPVRVYSKVGEVNGTVTDGYTYETKTEATTASTPDGQKIEVKAPRSITSMTFAFKLAVSSSNITVDNEDLLGWIIKNEPISSFANWYNASNSEINKTDVIRNTANTTENEYFYTYTKSADAQWEDNATKLRYFYAVNRAGLICQTPIIVEFKANPVPNIETRTYNEVETFENINYLKADSTITFTTTVPVTKIEFYKDGNLVLTKSEENTANFPVSSYTLTNSEILSTLTENTLTVKLFTATEESAQYVLTDSSHASSNKWTYDDVKPEIKEIKVEGLKKGTTDGTTFEYWATDSVNKTDVYITLKEEKTGVRVFDFTDSTIKLTSSSKLYNMSDNGTEITSKTVDTTNNKLTINAYNQAVRNESGNDVIVKITDVELVPATSTTTTRPDNKINLKLYDIAVNDSVAVNKFKFDTTTLIDGFNYDPSNPAVSTVTLADRAPVTVTLKNNDSFAIPVNPEYTNERYVKATVNITATESGVSQLTVEGATFVASGDDVTTIKIGNENVLFTISNSNKTITFDNNKVFKGTFTAEINNLLLPEYDSTVDNDTKAVSVTAINLGEKESTASEDTIILDMTPPAWNNTGLYTYSERYNHNVVNVSEDEFKTIYPHPSVNTEKVYGFVPEVTANPVHSDSTTERDIYFYTTGTTVCVEPDVTEKHLGSGNSNIFYMYFETIEGELTQDANCQPTTPFEFLGLTPIAADSKITTYVTDKAGNKSTTKTFHIVKDDVEPAAIEKYITLTKAMKNGVPEGQIFKSSDTEYVIKSLEDDVDPYKIIVKLGSSEGIPVTDTTIDETPYSNISGRPETAYAELYKNEQGNVSQVFAINKSPIEYFAITEGTSVAPTVNAADGSANGWISINDNTERTLNNKLTITGGGTITISLPKSQNCGTIYIHVKDGCGNVTTQSTEKTWTMDNGIGAGNYSVKFKGDTYNAQNDVDDTAYVTIQKPKTSTYTGGMASNNGVTYYNTTGSPQLVLSYKDECALPNETTATQEKYSLRGRLIAGNWGDSVPNYSEFILESSTEEITLTRKWATPWVPVVTQDVDSEGEMIFDFPTTNTADSVITGDSNTIPYELWYVVEDAVGNSKIMQVRNYDSSAQDHIVKTWMFDNTPPTLDEITIASFKKVNQENLNYYYSTDSTVTYTVRDTRAGMEDSGALYTTTTNTSLNSSPIMMTAGTNIRPYIIVHDYIGNEVTHYLTGTNTKWTRQNVPVLQETPAVFSGVKAGTSINAAITASGRFYVTKNGTTTTGITNTVLAERVITDITATLNVKQTKVTTADTETTDTETTDDSLLLGWIVRNSAYSANDPRPDFYDNIAANRTFVDVISNDISPNTNTYTFEKGDSTSTWQSSFSGSKYFYAVNKAGLICQSPIIINFANNPIPHVSGTFTYTNIETDTVNFIKSEKYRNTNATTIDVENPSSISFTSDIALVKCQLSSGSIVQDYSYDTSKTSHELTFVQSKWNALANSEIKLILSTATEDSDVIPLTKNNVSNWTYDATRPEFTTSIYHSDNTTRAAIENSNIWYLQSDKAYFDFAQSNSESDIKVYQYKDASDSNAVFENMPEDFMLDNTKTYKLRAIDKAGNPSAETEVQISKDVEGPNGSRSNITLVYSGSDKTKVDEIAGSNKTSTVYFNKTCVTGVTITASVTDNKVGIGDQYLYYKLNNGDETPATSNSITVALNENKTYKIIVKDKLGNETTLHTFTFCDSLPSGTVEYHSGANTYTCVSTDTGNGSSEAANAIVYYDPAHVTSISLTVTGQTASGSTAEADVYALKDNTGDKIPASSGTLTITPVPGSLYTIYVEDKIENKKLLKTYKFGTIAHSLKKDSSAAGTDYYKQLGTDTAPAIYYNKAEVNKLVLSSAGVNGISDGSGLPSTLYFREGSSDNAISNNTISLVSGSSALNTTYKIIAEDYEGNKCILKTFVLNGDAPTGHSDYSSTENTYVASDGGTGDTAVIYYDRSQTQTISISDISGAGAYASSAVSIYSLENDDPTKKTEIGTVTDGTLTITPVAGKYYNVYVEDWIHNRTLLRTYKFGTISYTPNYTQGNSSGGYNDVDTTGNSPEIYYNNSIVNGLTLVSSGIAGVTDGSSLPFSLKYRVGSNGVLTNLTDNTISLNSVLDVTYEIVAGTNSVLKTFKLNGKAPGGTVVYKTSQANTAISGNTIYYKQGSVSDIELVVTDVKDAAGNNLKVYYKVGDTIAELPNTNKLPCPTGSDYIATYEIYAVDGNGNKTIYNTYTLNGAGPVGEVTLTPVLKNGDSNADSKYYHNPENTKTYYYNKDFVKTLEVSISGVSGYGISISTNDANATINDKKCVFTLPQSGTDLTKSYTITATDGVGNTKDLATYVVNGNGPTGELVYDDTTGTGNSATYTKLVSASPNGIIYFNNTQVTTIKLKEPSQHPVQDASGQGYDLYYKVGNSAAQEINKSVMTIPCPDTGAGYTGTYKIIAIDKLGNESTLNTYVLNGALPTATVTKVLKKGENEVASGTYSETGKNIYYNKDSVDTLEITISNKIGCATIELTPQTNSTNGTSSTDASKTFTFTLPSSGDSLTANYKVIARDGVGNVNTIADFDVNGNAPSGTVEYKTPQDNTAKDGNNIYFKRGTVSNIELVATDVKDAAGNALDVYYKVGDTIAELPDTNQLPCPTGSDYIATYEIYAVDGIGNKTTYNTYTLNGAGPSATVAHEYKLNGTTVTNTNDTKRYSETQSGVEYTIYYNIARADTILSSISNVTGYNTSFACDVGNTTTNITEATYSINLPSDGDKRKSYEIIATDGVGNTKTVAKYIVNGNGPSGTISYEVPESSTTQHAGTGNNANTIYFKSSGEGAVTEITLTKGDDIKDAAGTSTVDLYWNNGNNSNKFGDTLTITCPTTNNNTGTYDIIGMDSLGNQSILNTFVLNGAGPDVSNASFTHTLKKEGTAVTSGFYISGNTIYYNKDSVDTLVITVTDLTSIGYNVTLSTDAGGSASGNTCTYTLPTTDPLTATYTITATDGVGNSTTVGSFNVNGNSTVVYDNDTNSSSYTKLVSASPNDIIYFNSTGTNALTVIKLKTVNVAADATLKYKIGEAEAVNISNKELPCNLEGKDYSTGVTYQILANDAVVKTYTLKSSAPTGGVSTSVYGLQSGDALNAATKADAENSKSGDYLLTSETNNGLVTDTVIYNPAKVNRIKITTSAITDCGAGGSYYILKTGDTEGTTHYTPVTDEITITLGSDWTTAHTYQVIAKDGVGNSKVVKEYSFKAHGTAPQVKNELKNDYHVAYSALPQIPTYPLVTGIDETTGKYNANLPANSNNWILGFDDDSNYKVDSKNNIGEMQENKDYYIVQYNGDGTPKYVDNTSNFDYISCNGYYIKNIKSSVNFTCPVKLNTLPTNILYFAVTYNDIRVPTTWYKATVQGSGEDGYITGVRIGKTALQNVNSRYTFIFVWYKDELGNICVHNLTMPEEKNNGHLFINWWTVLSNNALPSISMQEGTTNRPVVNFTYQDTPVNNSSIWSFIKPVAGISTNTASSSPIIIDQVPQGFTSSTFTDNFADIISDVQTVTKPKKARKGRKAAQFTDLAQKTSGVEVLAETVADTVVEATENVLKDSAIEETVQNVIESVTAVTDTTELAQKPADTVAPNAPDTTSSPADSVVTAVESVIDSVNASDNEVIVAEAPLGQAQFYEDEEVGLDMRSVYAAIAVLFVAIFALVCLLIRRKKNL
ncbi:MAG: hypothetical protein J5527_11330 [Treponema sp.]|nr:hypothetical protein [Treponema sp.]